jgi:hypothetical protein
VDTVKSFVVALALTLCFPCVAQEEEALEWDAGRRLTWHDFRGKPMKTAWAAATTASGISYEYSGEEKDGRFELQFKVLAHFYPEKSWYQPRLCDELVLSHEQLHFDISELFARKMRKEMGETRFTGNAKAEVKAIYKRIIQELSAFQSRYDHETNYSRDREKQLHWNNSIKDALLASESL